MTTCFDIEREIDEAQAEIDRVAPAVQAEIAHLEAPWTVCRTGLEVIEPPSGDPFTPWRVVLERHSGMERMVVAVPGAPSRSEAIRLTAAHCRAELAAYEKSRRDILRSHGVLELFAKLNRLKAEAKPVVRVLGREEKPEPEKRVINVEAPDEAELRRRQIAAQNKF